MMIKSMEKVSSCIFRTTTDLITAAQYLQLDVILTFFYTTPIFCFQYVLSSYLPLLVENFLFALYP